MSSDGDFKVIGINDEGTASRHGGDDLDKIAKILNGVDSGLDIIIDNDWIFNSSKLILHDTSGDDNKITIATSDENADWIITIPTLGGNQTPVFEDLEQTLSDKTLTSPTINSGTLSGTFTLPSAVSTPIKFVKPAASGAERFMVFEVDDDDTGSAISIENLTGNDDRFIPGIIFSQYATELAPAGYFIGRIDPDDDVENEISVFAVNARHNTAAVTNRPLFGVENYTTKEYLFYPTYADFKDNAIKNTSLDADDGITFANIPDDALSSNVALLDAANTFTDIQTIQKNTHNILSLNRNSNGAIEWGIDFNAKNSDNVFETYAAIRTGLVTNTAGDEDAYVSIQTIKDGTVDTKLIINHNGNLYIGPSSARAIFDVGNIASSDKIFTFPNESGTLALDGALGALDDLTDVDVTTVTPVDNYVLTYSASSGTWIAAEPPGASGGEANTLTNVGGENELVKPKVGVNYDIRTLEAGTNVTITQNANTITIAATDTNTITDALTDLTTDVSISSPSNLQVLAYNSSTSKWENNSFNAERTGKAVGDGGSTEYIIAHGLGSTPSYAFIDCSTHSTGRTWDVDDTNITVTFDSSLSGSTDAVNIYWRVIA